MSHDRHRPTQRAHGNARRLRASAPRGSVHGRALMMESTHRGHHVADDMAHACMYRPPTSQSPFEYDTRWRGFSFLRVTPLRRQTRALAADELGDERVGGEARRAAHEWARGQRARPVVRRILRAAVALPRIADRVRDASRLAQIDLPSRRYRESAVGAGCNGCNGCNGWGIGRAQWERGSGSRAASPVSHARAGREISTRFLRDFLASPRAHTECEVEPQSRAPPPLSSSPLP